MTQGRIEHSMELVFLMLRVFKEVKERNLLSFYQTCIKKIGEVAT